MKTLDILVTARANLARNPAGWCKGAMAKSDDGDDELGSVFDESCVSRCMMGETLYVSHSYARSMVADEMLKRAAYPDASEEELLELDLADFNDAPERTHAEVVAVFDRAIEMERNK